MCEYVFLVCVITEGYLSRYEAMNEIERERERKQMGGSSSPIIYYTLGTDRLRAGTSPMQGRGRRGMLVNALRQTRDRESRF
jgi:hypothetical protein